MIVEEVQSLTNDIDNIEIRKLRIEELRVDNELKFQQQELQLKREELSAKIKADEKSNQSIVLSPAFMATLGILIASIFTFVGSALGPVLQGRSNMSLEQQKFEANLITKAFEASDENKITRQLDFYIKSGLIKNQAMVKELSQYTDEPSTIPRLTAHPLYKAKMSKFFLDSVRNISTRGAPSGGTNNMLLYTALQYNILLKEAKRFLKDESLRQLQELEYTEKFWEYVEDIFEDDRKPVDKEKVSNALEQFENVLLNISTNLP